MKKAFLYIALATTMCSANVSAADTQKIHETVCKGKSQNAAVSYAEKGVLFNGTCQMGSNGKLSFQPPQPVATTNMTTESTLSVTATVNEDLGIDSPMLEEEAETTDANLIADMDLPVLEDEVQNTVSASAISNTVASAPVTNDTAAMNALVEEMDLPVLEDEPAQEENLIEEMDQPIISE